MTYKNIGDSDLKLSSITFGAWAAGGWMWGGTDRKKAVDAILKAYDLGVTSIDTAPVYGQGMSEEIVGEAIRRIPRSAVQIATKYGMRWDTTDGFFAFKSLDNEGREIDVYRHSRAASIINECEASLKRLGTDYIDLYQIHWPDPTTPMEETMTAVAKLIEQGKVRFAGVCNYDVAQLKEARQFVNIISNQVPYSMVKRHIEAETVPYCIENNISILAYSPLERGLLTGKMKPGYKFGEGDHRARLHFYTDQNLEATDAFLEKIRPIAEAKNATVAQVVLQWTLAQPGITVALVGARNPEQATENAQAIDITLSSEELTFISAELNELHIVKPN